VIAGTVSMGYLGFKAYKMFVTKEVEVHMAMKGAVAVGTFLGFLGFVLGIAGLVLDHEAHTDDNEHKGDKADQLVISAYVMTFLSLGVSITEIFLNK